MLSAAVGVIASRNLPSSNSSQFALALIDFTNMTEEWNVAGIGTRPVSMFGGSTTVYFSPGPDIWIGPTEPSCSISSYPAVFGCLPGVNIFDGIVWIPDPDSSNIDTNYIFGALEVDYTIQIREFNPNLQAIVHLNDINGGIKVEWYYDGIESGIRVIMGDDIFSETIIDSVIDINNIDNHKLRLVFGDVVGSPNETTIQLFLDNNLLGVSSPGLTPWVFRPAPITSPGRLSVQELINDGSLFNVRQIALTGW